MALSCEVAPCRGAARHLLWSPWSSRPLTLHLGPCPAIKLGPAGPTWPSTRLRAGACTGQPRAPRTPLGSCLGAEAGPAALPAGAPMGCRHAHRTRVDPFRMEQQGPDGVCRQPAPVRGSARLLSAQPGPVGTGLTGASVAGPARGGQRPSLCRQLGGRGCCLGSPGLSLALPPPPGGCGSSRAGATSWRLLLSCPQRWLRCRSPLRREGHGAASPRCPCPGPAQQGGESGAGCAAVFAQRPWALRRQRAAGHRACGRPQLSADWL